MLRLLHLLLILATYAVARPDVTPRKSLDSSPPTSDKALSETSAYEGLTRIRGETFPAGDEITQPADRGVGPRDDSLGSCDAIVMVTPNWDFCEDYCPEDLQQAVPRDCQAIADQVRANRRSVLVHGEQDWTYGWNGCFLQIRNSRRAEEKYCYNIDADFLADAIEEITKHCSKTSVGAECEVATDEGDNPEDIYPYLLIYLCILRDGMETCVN